MTEDTPKQSIYHPARWGLPDEAIQALQSNFLSFWHRYRPCFRTKTRRCCHHALTYLKGLMLLPGQRNFANIERRVLGIQHDGQDLQQFASDSPWEAQSVFSQIQSELQTHLPLTDSCLLLDDSGDDCDGDQRAGASKQYIGRLGKVEQGVVGVTLSYYSHQHRLSCMVDAELYLAQEWFQDDAKQRRRRCQIPEHRNFEPKTELAIKMIDRNRLPSSALCGDAAYGKDRSFRRRLDSRGALYMLDTTGKEKVYLRKPKVFVPKRKGKRGPKPTKKQVKGTSRKVEDVAKTMKLRWQRVFVRQTERGPLFYECAAIRVWTFHEQKLEREWLFVWKQSDGSYRYSMCNGKRKKELEKMAFLRGARYFVEHDYQKAKGEAGWDELEARKYRAWCHHTALCALAIWFVCWLKLQWAEKWPRDGELLGEFGIKQLPELSMQNVKELLLAVMPLKALSAKEAVDLVIQHLLNRARSTASRIRKHERETLLLQTNSGP